MKDHKWELIIDRDSGAWKVSMDDGVTVFLVEPSSDPVRVLEAYARAYEFAEAFALERHGKF